jgi:hypothetical protein
MRGLNLLLIKLLTYFDVESCNLYLVESLKIDSLRIFKIRKMKTTIIVLFFGLMSLISFGQTRHPYYGGGHHTTIHGGHYSGGTGSHHRGGHYVNVRTQNTYGRHKKR